MATLCPFSAYITLWSIANLLRIHVGYASGTALAGSVLDRSAVVLPILVFLAALMPTRSSGVIPICAMLMRAATNIPKGAHMSNSQIWATQHDLALLLAWWTCVRKRPAAALLRDPLSPIEESEVVGSCARTMRLQFAIFYFASGFWKLNSSFLHPSYSCASSEYLPCLANAALLAHNFRAHVSCSPLLSTVFTTQPLEYLPDAWLFNSPLVSLLATSIASVGPFATLGIETLLPTLHLLPSRWPRATTYSVAGTLLFHAVIGLTPPPSNVASYGVTTCTRLFFFLPSSMTATMASLGGARFGRTDGGASGGGASGGGMLLLASAMVLAAAAALAAVSPLHSVAVSMVQGQGTDWHLAWLAALTVLYAHALLNHPASRNHPEKPAMPWLVVLALVYAFALPVLGLQEKGGCLMFSQLRLHGGSNHLLLPTSLLQRGLADTEPLSAFAGGVVRVEATNLSWVGNSFAVHCTPRALRVLRDVAQVPAEYIWAEKASSAQRLSPPPRFLPYTISNLGLRMLLATAAKQGDAFWLAYTRLNGTVGDEVWRTRSSGAAHVVTSSGGGSIGCTDRGTWWHHAPHLAPQCSQREAALLSPAGLLSSAIAFWLVPQPNPIISGRSEEMHCVRWG